jgi:hypothetical protein
VPEHATKPVGDKTTGAGISALSADGPIGKQFTCMS